MTDKEIIKALECCLDSSSSSCKNCPLFNVTNSTMVCSKLATMFALDLINRQQEEIERLEKELSTATNHITRLENQVERLLPMLKTKRAEAIKEFAERLKTHTRKMQSSDFSGEFWDKAVLISDIDNLVKEMVGEQE